MIFITGCNGLVGSNIARSLLTQGEKIVALKRKNSDLSLVYDIVNSIEWIEGDLFDTALLNKVMSTCHTIIHAAAVISFAPRMRSEMYRVNVEGTANVVNAALLNPTIKKFCYISSIASLGRKKNEPIITEDSLWEESEMNTHYARSKYLAELEVWRGIEEGLPAFIVNPSVILGAGNWNNGSTKIFQYVYQENKFYTDGFISYVDVDDVTQLVLALLKKNMVGERYILNAGRVSYQELFATIASHFQKKPPSIKIHRVLAEIIWRIASVKAIFSKDEPILTKETVRLSKLTFEYKNDKISTELNFIFKPLTQTIEHTCPKLLQLNVHK
jgi:dihydroflavonol-4-reductase